MVDDEIQNLILKGADANVIRKAAVRRGMTTLRRDGAEKVVAGLTAVQEVARVSQDVVV